MQTLAGEASKIDRDGAVAAPPATFAPHPRPAQRRRLGLAASLFVHAALVALVGALGPSGRLPTPSSGETIVATLVVGLPQALRAPEPVEAPPTEELLPAAEPPPLPDNRSASPEPTREEPER